LDLLFAVWVLLLPFNVVPVVSTYSPDNLVAPVLGILGLLSRVVSPRSAHGGSSPWWIMGLCGLYALLNVMGTVVAGSLGQFASALWQEVRVALYFLLPVLFVRTIDQFNRCLILLCCGSVIVSLSAVAAGIGLLDVGFKTPETRFDIGVERSLGLGATSGVFAAWSLVALLTVMTAEQWGTRTILRHGIVRWAMYATLAAGVLAAQSRNVIMVVILGLVLLPAVRWFSRQRRGTILRVTIFLAPLLVVLLVVAPLLLSYLYEAFATVGGERTMIGRLEHYQVAWGVITQHPFGLSGSLRAKYEPLVDGTHSIWLGVLLKGGLPALLVLLAIFAAALTGPWNKLRRGVYPPQAAAMVVMALVMPVSGSFFVAHHNLIFWAFLGLPFAFQTLSDLPETSPGRAAVKPPSADRAGIAGVQRMRGVSIRR
jgi:O-antigen ligase